MKIDPNQLSKFFNDKLPSIDELCEMLSLHSFETEIVEGLLDVDVLPNRSSDCLSYYGIVKEVSAILGIPLKERFEDTITFLEETSDSNLSISIEDSRCRRYMGVILDNMEDIQTPEYIKEMLSASGINSINGIVDVTNYVLKEIGIPMHAFDLDKLEKINSSFKIIVKPSNDEATTLTGDKIKLKNAIVITDSKNPLAIGGIKGLDKACVDSNTKRILLEAASFEPYAIREISKDINLITDASSRFSQDMSLALVDRGMARAVGIFKEINPNTKIISVKNTSQSKPVKSISGVSKEKISNYLGSKISDRDIEKVFNKLNFKFSIVSSREKIIETAKSLIGIEYKYGASISLDAPSKFDCSSFTSYCYMLSGYQIPRVSIDQYLYSEKIDKKSIKEGDLVFFQIKNEKTRTEPINDFKVHIEGNIEGGVNHCGIMIDKNTFIHAKGEPTNKVIETKIEDFLSEDIELVGFGRILEKEKIRFVVESPEDRTDIKWEEDLIEEYIRIFGYENIKLKKLSKSSNVITNGDFYLEQEILEICKKYGFSEIKTSSFVSKGEVAVKKAKAQDRPFLRTNISDSMVQALDKNILNADLLGLTQIKLIEIGNIFFKDREEKHICIGIKQLKEHKGDKSDKVFENIIKEINTIGISFSGKLENGVWECVMPKYETENKYPLYRFSEGQFEEFSRYPAVSRDISFFVGVNIETKELEEIIKSNSGDLLIKLRLFDRYEKEDRVSYSYRLVFQSMDKTLTDEEVNIYMNDLTSVLENQGFKVR